MISKYLNRTTLHVLLIFTVCVGIATKIDAHEVSPNIAEIRIEGKSIYVDLRLNVEAFLADLNLAGLTNTDEAEESTAYKSNRALSAGDLERKLIQSWHKFAPMIKVKLSDIHTLSDWKFSAISVEDVENLDLPRMSQVSFSINTIDRITHTTLQFDKRFGTTILRQIGVENGLTEILGPGQESTNIVSENGGLKSPFSRFLEYIPIGFDHVVPDGLDHILFVVGLFLLSLKLSTLLWQVTAFTLAHSVTLIAGTLGVISVPASIVEPLIAASIVFIAVENIFFARLNPWRAAIVFAFGLLHGLGFASVLAEFGLPEGQYIPALIGFNLGVEFGQLSVIAFAFATLALPFGRSSYYRSRLSIPISCIIAIIGVWWILERTVLA